MTDSNEPTTEQKVDALDIGSIRVPTTPDGPWYDAKTDTITLNTDAPWYKKNSRRNLYNWGLLKQMFIEHPDPINAWSFCREQGFPNYGLMLDHMKTGQWNLEREMFWRRVHEERVETAAHAIANEGKEWDDACRKVAQKILDRINEELDGRDVQVVLKDGSVVLVHQTATAKDVAGAAKLVQDIGKTALGDTTHVSIEGFVAEWGAPTPPRKKEDE